MKYRGHEAIITFHTDEKVFSGYIDFPISTFGWEESSSLDGLEKMIKDAIDDYEGAIKI